MKKIIALLLLFLPFASLAAELPVASKIIDMGELATGRPASIHLWYPKGDCPQQSQALCLAAQAEVHKVIVFSHGAMGSAEDYAWLGESLAAAGFVVVGVNHFGESRIYGSETQDVRNTAFIWQRAQDISALLDKLAQANLFQSSLNWQQVVAIGHSAGGQTTAMLAGATYDLRQLSAYCASADSQGDHTCSYASKNTQLPDQFVQQFNGGQQDARVKKIVLLDPALGVALQPESLRDMRLPSLVIGATHNDFLPWAQHGQRYLNAIYQPAQFLLEGQEGHFVFLSPCTHAYKAMDVSLCEDRPGVDRNAVHRQLAQQIIQFVSINNEPVQVVQQSRASAQSYSLFMQIIMYTPRWVFGLLAGLCVFGLLQTRTRQVSVPVALILPVGMLILSLQGVSGVLGWQLPVLAAWLSGVSVAAIIWLKLMRRDETRYDPLLNKLTIQGSWIPLLIILAIFFTRYFLGVAQGMQLELLRNTYFPLLMSLLLGIWSGFFCARGIIYWQLQRVQQDIPEDRAYK